MSDLVQIVPNNSQRFTLRVPQGSGVEARIVRFVDPAGDPIDLTGWDFRMDIRREYDSSVLLSCTLANGRILVNNTVGAVSLAVPQGTFGVIPVGRYQADLMVLRPNIVTTWYPIGGIIEVTTQITRP
jgi:hypothetical protein